MRTLLAVAVVVALASSARASDPVGVYAIVGKTVEGKVGDTPTVQLYGWFAPFDPATGFYQKPQRGYMYFACAQGEESICAAEWADFTKISACVAFGSRRDPVTFKYRDNGTVRDVASTVTTPDPYPVAQGVSQPGDHSSQCMALAAASAGQAVPEPVAMPPAGTDPQLQTRGCSSVPGAGPALSGLFGVLSIALALGLRRRR